jgi:hypothetical protein
MLLYIKELILNGILPEDTFNNNQILEEKHESKILDIENKLLIYENHDILRGSLGLFINNNINHFNTLKKFSIIFDNNHKENTPLIRQALLSKADYSQQDNDTPKRFLVHRNDAWRNFFTVNQRRRDQEKIIEILNNISILNDLTTELEDIVTDFLNSDKKDWRYYFIKYDNKTHYSETQGYYYWKDRINLPLEVILLNSSYESKSNLEWNIYNWILFDNNRDISSLDYHGASNLILFKHGISINGTQKGFEVISTNEDMAIYSYLIENNIISKEGVYLVSENENLIEKGQELIMQINHLASPVLHNTPEYPSLDPY